MTKKKTTKFCCTICVILALFQLLIMSSVTVSAKHFSDINSDSPYLDAINYATDNGYILGTNSTTFSPSSLVTRAMIVYALYIKEGEPNASTNTGFTDVSSSAYYAKAVSWAKANNIAGGITPTTFEPNTVVRRQDIALFFYRYATFKGYDTSERVSVACFTDANEIGSYALDAVKWMAAKGVMRGITDTLYSPEGSMSRSIYALVLSRFGFKVEGIILNKDAFSFGNTPYDFERSVNLNQYYISESDKQILSNRLSSKPSSYSKVIDSANEPWGGSCFGMSAVTYLDKAGKIDFNGNRSTAKTMYEVESPRNNASVESAINYYQLSWVLPGIGLGYDSIGEHSIRSMIQHLEDYGIAQLVYTYNYTNSSGAQTSGAHAIVLYDVVRMANGGYLFTAYDNRYPNVPVQLSTNSALSTLTFRNPDNSTNVVKEILVRENYDKFDFIDIDGYDNAGSDLTSYTHNVINLDHTELYVSKASDFTITNAEGEILNYQNGEFSGSMNIISRRFIPTDSQSIDWVITVDNSTKFVFEGTGEYTDFHVLTANDYKGARGSNIDAIIVKEDGMCIKGINAKYTASTHFENTDNHLVCVKGIGETELTTSNDNLIVNDGSTIKEIEVFSDINQSASTAVDAKVVTGQLMINANSFSNNSVLYTIKKGTE